MRVLSLEGQKFGRLTVISRAGSSSHGKVTWLCECGCEKKTRLAVIGSHLRNGNTKSCDCLKREASAKRMIEKRRAAPVGKVFGRLTVLADADSIGGKAVWRCRCISDDCPEKDYFAYRLLNGVTASCGCLSREMTSLRTRGDKHAFAHQLRAQEAGEWDNL